MLLLLPHSWARRWYRVSPALIFVDGYSGCQRRKKPTGRTTPVRQHLSKPQSNTGDLHSSSINPPSYECLYPVSKYVVWLSVPETELKFEYLIISVLPWGTFTSDICLVEVKAPSKKKKNQTSALFPFMHTFSSFHFLNCYFHCQRGTDARDSC